MLGEPVVCGALNSAQPALQRLLAGFGILGHFIWSHSRGLQPLPWILTRICTQVQAFPYYIACFFRAPRRAMRMVLVQVRGSVPCALHVEVDSSPALETWTLCRGRGCESKDAGTRTCSTWMQCCLQWLSRQCAARMDSLHHSTVDAGLCRDQCAAAACRYVRCADAVNSTKTAHNRSFVDGTAVAALDAERNRRRMTIVAADCWPWSLTCLAESLAVGRRSWVCGLLPDAASESGRKLRNLCCRTAVWPAIGGRDVSS